MRTGFAAGFPQLTPLRPVSRAAVSGTAAGSTPRPGGRTCFRNPLSEGGGTQPTRSRSIGTARGTSSDEVKAAAIRTVGGPPFACSGFQSRWGWSTVDSTAERQEPPLAQSRATATGTSSRHSSWARRNTYSSSVAPNLRTRSRGHACRGSGPSHRAPEPDAPATPPARPRWWHPGSVCGLPEDGGRRRRRSPRALGPVIAALIGHRRALFSPVTWTRRWPERHRLSTVRRATVTWGGRMTAAATR